MVLQKAGKKISLLLCFFLFVSLLSSGPVYAVVGESWVDLDFHTGTPGWGITHFASIQSAIDGTDPGGIVHVSAGAYAENLRINKSIDLLGAGASTTIIDAQHNGSGIRIESANGVTIAGFHLINSRLNQQEYEYPAITAETCTNLFVENCIIDDVGICMIECSTSTIRGNTIDAHVPVILHSGRDNIITENVMTARHPQGVGLYGSHGNQVTSNQITGWSEGPG